MISIAAVEKLCYWQSRLCRLLGTKEGENIVVQLTVKLVNNVPLGYLFALKKAEIVTK